MTEMGFSLDIKSHWRDGRLSRWTLKAIRGTAGCSDDACQGTSWVKGGVMTNSGYWVQSILPR